MDFSFRQSDSSKQWVTGNAAVKVTGSGEDWESYLRAGQQPEVGKNLIVPVELQTQDGNPVSFSANDAWKVGITTSAGAGHELQLIWPGESSDTQLMRGLNPSADQVLLRLCLFGKAQASVAGCIPVGPLTTNFGVAAGGHVAIERLKLFPGNLPLTELIPKSLSGIRFPQQIDSANEIPEGDEVLVSRFGGYLKVSSQVSYGYSFRQCRSLEIGGLQPDLEFNLKIAAGLMVGYQMAGEFEIEARRGSSDGFIRYVVRKSRKSVTNLIADFGMSTQFGTVLPKSSQDFLSRVFGVHMENAFGILEKVQSYSDLDQQAGKLLKSILPDFSKRLFGESLSPDSIQPFLKKVREVITRYRKTDPRIIHLYEDHFEQLPELVKAVQNFTRLKTIEELRSVDDSFSLSLLQRMCGDQIHDVFLKPEAFAEFLELMKKTEQFLTDAEQDQLRNVVRFFPESVPVQSMLNQLKTIDALDKLKQLRDGKSTKLAEILLGEDWENIPAAQFVLKLRNAVGQIESFQEKYYSRLVNTVNRNFQANIQFAYVRATQNTALLDVEIDLREDEGRKLAKLATRGDFSELLSKYQSRLVRIHQGVLTHSTMKSSRVQVNLFGRVYENFTQISQDAEETIEEHEGGLLHIYSTKTAIEERKKRGGELTASTFLIATTAQSFQAEGQQKYMLDSLPRMSIQYDLLHQDNLTGFDEIHQMLEFAELMGLVRDRMDFVEGMKSEFPQGLGNVSAKYMVRYEEDAVIQAFLMPITKPAEQKIRNIIRTFISARYIGLPGTNWSARMGFAYASPVTYQKFSKLGFAAFVAQPLTVQQPGWYAGKTSLQLQKIDKENLVNLYGLEDRFIKRYGKLSDSVQSLKQGKSIHAKDLDQQVHQLVELSDNLNQYRASSFFVVLDSLIQFGNPGKARNSSLILEIQPPGSSEKVIKVLPAMVI